MPAPENVEDIVGVDHNFGDDGEIIENMIDEEMDALPEC